MHLLLGGLFFVRYPRVNSIVVMEGRNGLKSFYWVGKNGKEIGVGVSKAEGIEVELSKGLFRSGQTRVSGAIFSGLCPKCSKFPCFSGFDCCLYALSLQ